VEDEVMTRKIDGMINATVTFIVMVVITSVFDLLWAFPVMWSWNYVMPYLFELPKLNWSMSFCLLFILTSLWKISIVGYEK
jgi:hypothetical protein